MSKIQILGVLLVILLAVLGAGVLVGGLMHLYQDHQWDDQIRAIQKQQLTQPKPAPTSPPAQ